MTDKTEQGHWLDGKGEAVPLKYISKVDQKRDRLVERLHKRAKKLQAELAAFKAQGFEESEAYLNWLETTYDIKAHTKVGNKTLTNFSANRRLEVRVAQIIDFDERLALAKEMIDQCLERWSTDSEQDLQVVIAHAFQMDKKGKLDRGRILSLLRLQIKDPEWKKAMELIKESIRIVDKRAYLLFSERDSQGKWQTISLNMAEL